MYNVITFFKKEKQMANNNNNFSLVDFFNAFKNRKTYEKYTQDGSYKTTDQSKWSNADVNNDGKLDVRDGQKLEQQYNTVSKSKTVYDITQDGEVKFDDLFGFSEDMDINGDGRTCGLEKEFLQGKTKLVYAQVKENLDNAENLELSDLMDYSKAVSDLDSNKKESLNNEIATLEQTMINKLKAKNLQNGDINDLKSFWKTTTGADKLNLGHGSQLIEFLDETETGLRTNVKRDDQTMTDQRLDSMKREIQGTSEENTPVPTQAADDGCGCGETRPSATTAPSVTSTPSASADPDCPGFTCRHNPSTLKIYST